MNPFSEELAPGRGVGSPPWHPESWLPILLGCGRSPPKASKVPGLDRRRLPIVVAAVCGGQGRDPTGDNDEYLRANQRLARLRIRFLNATNLLEKLRADAGRILPHGFWEAVDGFPWGDTGRCAGGLKARSDGAKPHAARGEVAVSFSRIERHPPATNPTPWSTSRARRPRLRHLHLRPRHHAVSGPRSAHEGRPIPESEGTGSHTPCR